MFLLFAFCLCIAAAFSEEKAHLLKVFIYTRHGARSPYVAFPRDNVSWYCDEVTADSVAYTSKGINQMIGKGFLHIYDKSNVLPGTCYQGQLTSVGLAEQRLLGIKYRYKYIHALHFAPEEFNASFIRLRSTDITRTRQSLASQLLGWYEQSISRRKIHPVINIQEKDTDPLADQSWCTAFSSKQKRIQDANIDLIAVHRNRLRELQDIFGYEGDKEDNEYDIWYTIWDNLVTRTWLGISFPQGVTYADLVTGNNIADISTAIIYCNEDPEVSRLMKQARIGPYITELIDLINADDGPGSERLHITACHDTTIMPLMATFAGTNWDCNWPPYASHIELEIWKHESDKYVRIYYMGKRILPVGCTDSRICLLDNFIDKIRDISIPYEDWNEICTTKK